MRFTPVESAPDYIVPIAAINKTIREGILRNGTVAAGFYAHPSLQSVGLTLSGIMKDEVVF